LKDSPKKEEAKVFRFKSFSISNPITVGKYGTGFTFATP